MSADSFHHLVEGRIRRKKYLYNFADYVECVESVGKASLMLPDDFIDYSNKKSTAKDTNYPKLSDLSVAEFRNGSTKMFWKTSFDQDEFFSGEFLQ